MKGIYKTLLYMAVGLSVAIVILLTLTLAMWAFGGYLDGPYTLFVVLGIPFFAIIARSLKRYIDNH